MLGGAILLVSALLLAVILLRSLIGARAEPQPLHFSLALDPPTRIAPALPAQMEMGRAALAVACAPGPPLSCTNVDA